MGEMTNYERLEAAWRLEKADRVPVVPYNVWIVPYLGGLSIKEALTKPEKLLRALADCRDITGDCFHPVILTLLDHLAFLGGAGFDQASLDWRISDHFPPEGNIPSLYEKPFIEDYDDVMERGFSTILFNRKLENNVFRRSIDEFLYYQFEYPQHCAELWREYVKDCQVPLMFGGRATHPLDLLQSYQTLSLLTKDIYEVPDKVKEMCDWLVNFEAARAMRQAAMMGAGEVPGAETIIFFNGGPPGMSPRIFDEFFWPYAKKMVDIFVGRGFKVWCHWDGNLTPHLNTIKGITDGLPKGRVLMDLEKTDLRKAKAILGQKVCIYGNVPSALLVYGSPAEVEDYCKQLIQDCGADGGYILGTECEVPWDSKRENVQAIIRAAEKYGCY